MVQESVLDRSANMLCLLPLVPEGELWASVPNHYLLGSKTLQSHSWCILPSTPAALGGRLGFLPTLWE